MRCNHYGVGSHRLDHEIDPICAHMAMEVIAWSPWMMCATKPIFLLLRLSACHYHDHMLDEKSGDLCNIGHFDSNDIASIAYHGRISPLRPCHPQAAESSCWHKGGWSIWMRDRSPSSLCQLFTNQVLAQIEPAKWGSIKKVTATPTSG